MTLLKDKKGKTIPLESIIFGNLKGQKEKHIFNFGLDANTGTEFEMIACTYGYVHNVQQSDLENFLLIGSFEDFQDLLICD